jgi:hypothetical protein
MSILGFVQLHKKDQHLIMCIKPKLYLVGMFKVQITHNFKKLHHVNTSNWGYSSNKTRDEIKSHDKNEGNKIETIFFFSPKLILT